MTDIPFVWKQGDSGPTLTAALAYDDGTPLDLTGSTVQLVLRNPGDTSTYLNEPMMVVDTTHVSFTPASADTATPGDYLASFVVTFAGGQQQTFPTSGYQLVVIEPALAGMFTPVPTGITLAEGIEQTRDFLQSGQLPILNQLGADISTTDIQVTFRHQPVGIQRGTRLEWGAETVYVWDVAGTVVTVQRGWENSVPQDATAGTLVQVNPRFTAAKIVKWINQELTALPAQGLYRVATADFTTDPILWGYPMPADVIEAAALDVSWLMKSAIEYRPQIDDYRVALNVPKDEFPTGNAFFFYKKPLPGQPFRITYKAAFNPLLLASDQVVPTTGIPETAVDILWLGAALRGLAGSPNRRADFTKQGDTQRADEVRVQDTVASPGPLRAMWQRRLADEVAKLDQQFANQLIRRSLL